MKARSSLRELLIPSALPGMPPPYDQRSPDRTWRRCVQRANLYRVKRLGQGVLMFLCGLLVALAAWAELAHAQSAHGPPPSPVIAKTTRGTTPLTATTSTTTTTLFEAAPSGPYGP